jgi:hypothetical protein
MVNRLPLARGRGGRITTRGLLTLLLAVVAIYYGTGAVTLYYRYWRMKTEMRTQARLAPGLDDDVIRRRLVIRATALGLPDAANRFVIRRRVRPPEIIISTSWQEILELPFTAQVITVRPEARAPL